MYIASTRIYSKRSVAKEREVEETLVMTVKNHTIDSNFYLIYLKSID